jgi:hypothetical protein
MGRVDRSARWYSCGRGVKQQTTGAELSGITASISCSNASSGRLQGADRTRVDVSQPSHNDLERS